MGRPDEQLELLNEFAKFCNTAQIRRRQLPADLEPDESNPGSDRHLCRTVANLAFLRGAERAWNVGSPIPGAFQDSKIDAAKRLEAKDRLLSNLSTQLSSWLKKGTVPTNWQRFRTFLAVLGAWTQEKAVPPPEWREGDFLDIQDWERRHTRALDSRMKRPVFPLDGVDAPLPVGSPSIVTFEEGARRDPQFSADYGRALPMRSRDHQYANPDERPKTVGWPDVPPLASAFQPRSSLRERITAAQDTAPSTVIIWGGGGVGKSQLAAKIFREAEEFSQVDLLVWAKATTWDGLMGAYANAARMVQAPGVQAPGADTYDLDASADAFLAWANSTRCSWLVVLDDVTKATAPSAGIKWPTSRTGRGHVLATTRYQNRGFWTGGGRILVDLGTYSPDEAGAYLRERLTSGIGLLDDHNGGICEALGYLPLALGFAAAYMLMENVNCKDYLTLYRDRSNFLDEILPVEADADGYGKAVSTALLLGLEAADARIVPHGLASAVMSVGCLLDPLGHPQGFWAVPKILAYLTDRLPRDKASADQQPRVTTAEVVNALRELREYAIISHTPSTSAPVIRNDPGLEVRDAPSPIPMYFMHALTGRAAQDRLLRDIDQFRTAVLAAADVLQILWPDPEHTQPALAEILSQNATTIFAAQDDVGRTRVPPVRPQTT